MKFLHIADLHLGKRLNEYDLLADQQHALQQLLDLARREQVQAVLVAGDIYDKASPSAPAMDVFSRFIYRLSEAGISAYLIGGNHDNPQRIAYLSELICKCGVFAASAFDGRLQSFCLEDEYGPIFVHLLPFLKPVTVRNYYPERTIATCEDAVRAVLEASGIDPALRNVLLCHQLVMGASTCDSEELSIGGLDSVSADVFDAFDYVALGHIHTPQPVKRPELRYSGSLLKYSFSEIGHPKSAVMVELKQKGTVQISTVPIVPLHEMREVKGDLETLMQMPDSQDYIRAVVTDELVRPDARGMLATVFPNMMRFGVENSKTTEEINITAVERLEEKTPLELFTDFYMLRNNGCAPSEAHLRRITQVIEQLEGSVCDH